MTIWKNNIKQVNKTFRENQNHLSQKHSTYTRSQKLIFYQGLNSINAVLPFFIILYFIPIQIVQLNLLIAIWAIITSIWAGYNQYFEGIKKKQQDNQMRMRQNWQVQNIPYSQFRQMYDLYLKKGIDPEDAQRLAKIMLKYKQPWVQIMLIQQHFVFSDDNKPHITGLSVFFSSIVFRLVPILFVIIFNSLIIGIACVICSCCMAIYNEKWTGKKWIKGGLSGIVISIIVSTVSLSIILILKQ